MISGRGHPRRGSQDPAGFDIVVNATPPGMNGGDPMPMDVVVRPRTSGKSS